ncbi:hypothetical protein Tco_0276242 [Tanacetum coccineum]
MSPPLTPPPTSPTPKRRTTVTGQIVRIRELNAADAGACGQVAALQGQVTALQGQQGPAGGPTQPELPEEAGSSS